MNIEFESANNLLHMRNAAIEKQRFILANLGYPEAAPRRIRPDVFPTSLNEQPKYRKITGTKL